MFDRYLDVQASLDRVQREEPPCHQRARQQLSEAGIKVKPAPDGIIRVLPDAILFVNDSGVVMTAWSEVREKAATVFYCEPGLPATPPAERA